MLDTVYLDMLTLGLAEEQAQGALGASTGEADSAGVIEECTMQPGNQGGCALEGRDGVRRLVHMGLIMAAHTRGPCLQMP